jgi:hypothetical protein
MNALMRAALQGEGSFSIAVGIIVIGRWCGDEGRGSVKTFWHTLTAFVLLPLPAVSGQELPKELLLHCEGKMNAVLDGPRSDSRSANFSIDLRLKDGSISDAQTGVVEGDDCVQDNGEIKCTTTRTYPLPNSVIKRFSTVVINRNTRELTLWLESWDYPGRDASGTPTAHMRVLRTALCRDSAIF